MNKLFIILILLGILSIPIALLAGPLYYGQIACFNVGLVVIAFIALIISLIKK